MTRKIHMIWVSRTEQPVPERYVEFQAEWKRLHPDWTFTVWEIDELLALGDDVFQQAWLKTDMDEAALTNRMRFVVLAMFGGLYVDVDTKPIRSLAHLLEQGKQFQVGETPVCSKSGHPMVELNLIYSAEGCTIPQELLRASDFPRTTEEINAQLRASSDRIAFHPAKYFQDIVATPETYSLHWPHHLSSWKNNR